MSVTIQTVTTDLVDAIGGMANGTVSIRPNASWAFNAAGSQDVLVPTPKTVTVTNGKVSAFQLHPTTGDGITLSNARYIATFNLANTPAYTQEWIIDAAVGSALEWAAIQIAASSLTTPPTAPLPGPAGPAGAAGATGSMVATGIAVSSWDDYTTNAFLAGPNTLINSPPAITGANSWWYVQVIQQSASWSIQIARDLGGVAHVQRYYSSGTWGPWRPIGSLGRKIVAYANGVSVSASVSTGWVPMAFNTVNYNENVTDLVLASNTIAAPAWASSASIKVTGGFTAAASNLYLSATRDGVISGTPNYSLGAAAGPNHNDEHVVDMLVSPGQLIGASIYTTDTVAKTSSSTGGFCSLSVEFK